MTSHFLETAKTDITLLLVEDSLLSREMTLFRLKDRYKRVLVAADGLEGLALFNEHAPDIVLSDHMMPGLTGLELSRTIRALGQDTPILLMTSDTSNQTLLEAINIGVNRFIPKPFVFDALFRLLDDLTREVINRRELDQRRLRELALLRDRDNYNWTQQLTARRKERHVVRNDLRNRLIEGPAGALWGLTVTHTPRDIMCGDGYSVRELFDGRQLIFVMDAMGSGLSASLSALLATSFCNYQVDHLHQWQHFSLQLFLSRFQEYLGSILLEEEVLSCGFFLVDLAAEQVDFAIFGLPALLVRKADGRVHKVLSNNAPLSIFSDELEIGTLSLTQVADLMLVTDGVTDALLENGQTYRELLLDDYRLVPTLARLQHLFLQQIVGDDLDDFTLLQFQRLDPSTAWQWSCELSPSPDGVESAISDFLQELSGPAPLSDELCGELIAVLNAALLNARQHGTDPVRLSASLWCGAGKPLLAAQVADSGPGLPAETLLQAAAGSGLETITTLCDAVFTGGPGGRLILLKTMDG
jgi:DNA-binding response OmpR family regulator